MKRNRWNIPKSLEAEVIERDRCCVYCGVEFIPGAISAGQRPTWEHIINDARIVTRDNIVRCCASCNASKGTKDLAAWLKSQYCRSHGITIQSVSAVVRASLESRGGHSSSTRQGAALVK